MYNFNKNVSDLINFEDSIVNSLESIDFCIFGYMSFESQYLRIVDNCDRRFKTIERTLDTFCNRINKKKDRLSYLIKDEIAKGSWHHPDGFPHSHVLIGSRHLCDEKDYGTQFELTEILEDLWTGPNARKPRFGRCKLDVIHKAKMHKAIRYTVKTWHPRHSKNVYNLHTTSTGLKKQQRYYKSLNEYSTIIDNILIKNDDKDNKYKI